MVNKKLTNSLIYKISLQVISVEIILLAIVGAIYINSFFDQVENRLKENVQLPSQLIQGGLVRLVSLNDPDSLRLLVGDNIQQVILTDTNGQVVFSLDPEYNQSNVSDIPFLDEAWFQSTESITDWNHIDGKQSIFNVSRITGTNDLFLYVQSDTSEAQAQKRDLLIIFLVGSLATLVATSGIVILFFQRTIFSRLNRTITTLGKVEQGNLRARIHDIDTHDEIASLQHSVNNMIEQLQSFFSTLEFRVEERTKEAEEARKIAEEASQAKSIFLSNMSHELRTPLNTVIGYGTSMLTIPEMYEGKSLDPVFEKDISTMVTNGKYLLGLINDILDLSKIEAGKLTLDRQAVDLVDTFNGVFSTITGLLQGKSIQLRPDYPSTLPKVWADPLRIRQILLNLLSNAVKYTKSGSVTLSAKVVEDELIISVTDTGAGIPEEMLEYIFDRFTQVKLEHQFQGTGLGLDICQRLCRMHDSELKVSSIVEQGSTFTFHLPLATPEQLLESTLETSAQVGVLTDEGVLDPSSYYNILIVAPSSKVRINLRKAFEADNHNVFESVDAEEGMLLAEGLLPDFVVIDAAAIDIIESLRSNDATKSIMLVVLGTEKSMPELEPFNVDLYLKKPMHGKRILENISTMILSKEAS